MEAAGATCGREALAALVRQVAAEPVAKSAGGARDQTGLLDAFDAVDPVSAVSVLAPCRDERCRARQGDAAGRCPRRRPRPKRTRPRRRSARAESADGEPDHRRDARRAGCGRDRGGGRASLPRRPPEPEPGPDRSRRRSQRCCERRPSAQPAPGDLARPRDGVGRRGAVDPDLRSAGARAGARRQLRRARADRGLGCCSARARRRRLRLFPSRHPRRLARTSPIPADAGSAFERRARMGRGGLRVARGNRLGGVLPGARPRPRPRSRYRPSRPTCARRSTARESDVTASPFIFSSVEPDVYHQVEVSKPGYRTWSARLLLQPGKELQLPLVKLIPTAPAPTAAPPAPAEPPPVVARQPEARARTRTRAPDPACDARSRSRSIRERSGPPGAPTEAPARGGARASPAPEPAPAEVSAGAARPPPLRQRWPARAFCASTAARGAA